VRPAGILGDIPAHRACRLTGGVWHIVEAVREHGLGKAGIHHAGLKDRAPPDRVDFENPVHSGQGNQHRVRTGQRATGKSGSGAAGHKWHVHQVEEADNLPHLSRIRGHDNNAGY
jgi:hypothetical protein